MCYHVFFKGTSLCAGVVTLRAIKRLLSTMNQHVSFQISSFDGWVAALFASAGLLSIMLKHMHFEVFGYLKGESALNTFKMFFFSLHLHGFSLFGVHCFKSNDASRSWDNWRQRKLFRMWIFLESESNGVRYRKKDHYCHQKSNHNTNKKDTSKITQTNYQLVFCLLVFIPKIWDKQACLGGRGGSKQNHIVPLVMFHIDLIGYT